MRRTCVFAITALLAAAAWACGGQGVPVDDGSGYNDVLILFDHGNGQDTNVGVDIGGRDHTIAIDEGGQDTTLPGDHGNPGDTAVTVDQGGADTTTPVDTNQPQDTDQPVDTSTGVDQGQPVDNGTGADTATPEDTTTPADTAVPEDTFVPDCSGSCVYGTDRNWCFDGGSLCVCSEGGAWTSTGCAGACTADGMVGSACVTNASGSFCNCTYDCGNSTLVQTQCTNLTYTPCTCATADPCGWQDDGYCDKLCEMAFPGNYFVETDDCECSGSCSASTFAGFCDNDGGACSCSLGSMSSTNCADYCTDMGADLHAGEWCYTYQATTSDPPEAACACENFDCDDSWGVDTQCDNLLYTPCTCAADNPCLWIGDGYCDSPTCNQLFPDQQNFDDSASDC